MTLRDQILGGMLGLCVGDALGVPVEFRPREQLRENPVTDMTGFGTHYQPPGTWSDDSSLTFCLAESLCAGYDIADIARRFLGWYDHAEWTPHGKVFDVGVGTGNAINRLRRGTAPVAAGGRDQDSNGNGSLMRTLPLAFYLAHSSSAERFKAACDVSCITHAHPRAQLACVIYVEMAVCLLEGLPPAAALAAMRRRVQTILADSEVTYIQETAAFRRTLDMPLADLDEVEIASSGYVVHTLDAALWCLLTSSSYRETVLKAVNLGADTDTTGAVAGGLAGLVYGVQAIPLPWRHALARKDDVTALCEHFADVVIARQSTDTAGGSASQTTATTLPSDHAERLARARLSLQGLSVGDALGQQFFNRFAESLIAKRTLPAPPWHYTDDTVMALSIFELLQDKGRIDQDDLAQRFAARFDEEPDRGYGGTAQRILWEIGRGEAWRQAAGRVFDGHGSMGNGGAMRAGPLGAYFADDFAQVVANALLSAEVTHTHPDGQAGAIAVAIAVAQAYQGRDLPAAEAGRALFGAVIEHTPDTLTRSGVIRAAELSLTYSVDTAIHALGNGSQVVSYDTVPFCIWCAARHLHDFKESIWTTVSGLGDRDTTCAIVGSIVAMGVGEAGIPVEWIECRERLRLRKGGKP
jgi:ADP-ribosylglycohydrolase